MCMSILSEETVTLTSLGQELQPHLKQLEVLDRVFAEGVTSCQNSESCSQRAAHLLSVLYDSLLLFDAACSPSDDVVGVSFVTLRIQP